MVFIEIAPYKGSAYKLSLHPPGWAGGVHPQPAGPEVYTRPWRGPEVYTRPWRGPEVYTRNRLGRRGESIPLSFVG